MTHRKGIQGKRFKDRVDVWLNVREHQEVIYINKNQEASLLGTRRLLEKNSEVR